MKIPVIVFTALLVCGFLLDADSADAQERQQEPTPVKTSSPNPESEPQRRRPAAGRPQRKRPLIEVKDPAGFVAAGQKEVFSGPQPGEMLPSLSVIGLAGDWKEQELDPVELADGKPMVLIFLDQGGSGVRGAFGFARAMKGVSKKAEQEIAVTAVFLEDDTTKVTEAAKRFGKLLSEFMTLTVSPDGRDGPGAFGLNRNVAMTVLVCREGKVLHNFPMTQPMLYSDPYVFGAVADLIGETNETLAKWLNDESLVAGMKRQRSVKQQSVK